MVFTSGRGTTFAHLLDVFSAKFGIDYNLTPGRGREIQDRAMAEQSAGRYLVDAWGSGQTSHVGLAEFGGFSPFLDWIINPEIKDPGNWKDGRFYWADAEQQYSFVYATNLNEIGVVVNTDLVDPTEIQVHADLVDLQWKGKDRSEYPPRPG